MKKIISLLLTVVIMSMSVTALAKDVTVLHNGTPIEFDAAPFIENDRTLVPMRKVFEAVGAVVTWEEETRTVVVANEVEDDVQFIVLQIGSNIAYVNDEAVELDVAAKIYEDRTFVPLRFVMESMGCEVGWDEETYTVTIKSN